jgi:hypothetical protein
MMHYSEPPQLEQQGRVPAELTKAVGGTPKLAGFVEALRDFINHSKFEAFFEQHQPFYTKLAEAAHRPTLALAGKMERDTGTGFDPSRFVLAPLLSTRPLTACQAFLDEAPEARLIVGVRDGVEPSFTRPAQFRKAFAAIQTMECRAPGARIAARTQRGASGNP